MRPDCGGKNFVSRAPKLVPFFVSSVLIALADQIMKLAVVANFALGESLTIIPGFFSFTYYRNRGGAFSLLAGLPPVWGRTFFIVATLAALGFVFYLYRFNPPETRWGRVGLVMISGGGLGNLVDRVVYGEVIDFVLFYYRGYAWPAFNLADSCITVGVVFLAVDLFRNPYGEPSGGKPPSGDLPNGDLPGGSGSESGDGRISQA